MTLLLRQALGADLRKIRIEQGRTLREVSASAAVSLGYLSEIERGHKEASSELLASVCEALDVEVADVLIGTASALRPGSSNHESFSRVAAEHRGMARASDADDVRIVIPAMASNRIDPMVRAAN